MATVSLNMYQALAVAAAMLVVGQILVNKIEFLRRYCIPAPVVGGLIFAIVHTILRGVGVVEFEMDTTLQTVFMTAFFCSVGFLAAFGIATMWLAVFADVGVTVLAVLNAMRALRI